MTARRKRPRKSADLVRENARLQARLQEAEETLKAIRRGDVDGLVVDGDQGKQLYTLKGADETYRTLVEAMSEGALILSPDGTIFYSNHRFSEIVRTPLSRVMGASVRHFIPESAESASDKLLGSSRAAQVQQEAVLQRADRTLVPVLLSAGPITIEERSGIGLLVTDLTDQKERERARAAERKAAEDQIRAHAESLERANRALEVTNQELETFVYTVSHDLRAPLRSVHRHGTTILEEHGATLDRGAKDHLGLITAAAQHMDDLIRHLLAYSHVSRQEITLRAVDTDSVVSEVLKHLEGDIRERGAEVQVEKPLPHVVGDVVLLSQAFANLISNGLKFIPAGTRPALRVRAESRDSTVRLWVEDNGIGVPEPDQSRLFRLFERLSPTFQGTGIGLAIVKRAVERMGGEVGVESRAGAGSRFWMNLRSPGSPPR